MNDILVSIVHRVGAQEPLFVEFVLIQIFEKEPSLSLVLPDRSAFHSEEAHWQALAPKRNDGEFLDDVVEKRKIAGLVILLAQIALFRDRRIPWLWRYLNALIDSPLHDLYPFVLRNLLAVAGTTLRRTYGRAFRELEA